MANPIVIIRKIVEFEQLVADFIQNGPDDGIQGYIRDRYRDRCNQFGNIPQWARALGGPAFASTGRICRPYWNDNGWDGPVLPPPPFTGGQCYGLQYLYDFTANTPSGGRETSAQGVSGRIIGTEQITLPGGNTQAGINRQLAPGGPIDFIPLQIGNPGQDLNPVISNVRRQDGGPDDCGDPPQGEPVPGPNPPPDPGPLPGPEPTDDPRDPTGPPLFPIPPYEDPVSGPIPIIEPEGEPGGGGPPSGGDGLPGSPTAIGAEAGGVAGGQPGEDVDLGEPPAGSVWVGVLVEATVDPRYGTIPSTGPDNTVYPSTIGNASLIYQGGRGTNVRVLSRFTELFRPVTALVLTGCRVSALPGVSLTVRGISALSCPDNPCEETDG